MPKNAEPTSEQVKERTQNERVADGALEDAHKDGIRLAALHKPHPREFGGVLHQALGHWRWEIDNPISREEYWRQWPTGQ